MNPCDRAMRRLRAGGTAALDDDDRTHVAACATCSDGALLLPLVGDGETATSSDAAWASFGERLDVTARDETVALRPPPLGWRVALALAAGAGSFMLVPEPLQVLRALGVL